MEEFMEVNIINRGGGKEIFDATRRPSLLEEIKAALNDPEKYPVMDASDENAAELHDIQDPVAKPVSEEEQPVVVSKSTSLFSKDFKAPGDSPAATVDLIA